MLKISVGSNMPACIIRAVRDALRRWQRNALSVRGGLHSDGASSTSGSDGVLPRSDSIFEKGCVALGACSVWVSLEAGVL